MSSGPIAPDQTSPTSGEDRARTRRSRRGRRRIVLLVVLLVLVVLGVVLVLGALSLVHAKREADAAQNELKAAKSDVSAHHLASARAHIRQARSEVDTAESQAGSFGADVWSFVPVAGGAVHDARHLVDALDQTTSVAQEGVALYPMVSGKNAHLVRGETIDLKVLNRVVARTTAIGTHLDQAMSDLGEVHGSTPIVGSAVTRAKDSALGYLTPLQDTYNRAGPLVSALPSMVGASGPRTYLLAMLNPAELRFSGGASLSFTTVRFDQGTATFGSTVNVDDLLRHGDFQTWRPVPGSTFRHGARGRVTNATFSPWWSVSGRELLGGYEAAYPRLHLSGVIGIDLQALADQFRISGPVDLPDFGTITADNLLQKLAGSYGDYSSTAVRHELNKELVPAFRNQFFAGGQITQKMSALGSSADGRHFFVYVSDPSVEHSFRKIGLAGDLSRTRHDYLGVFTQNLNGSKTDYFQHRTLTSHVALNADGSATVHLQTNVANDAPPYNLPGPDPKVGYTTRFLGALVGVFLPKRSTVDSVTVNGRPSHPFVHHPHVRGVMNREYFEEPIRIDAGQNASVDTTYKVPHAAVVDGSSMTYELSIDPQDTVVPATAHVIVSFPSGWAATSLPAGWKALGPGKAELLTPVTKSVTYSIPLHRG